MFYLTELINLPIRTVAGERVGRVGDLILEPERDPNRVQYVLFRQQGRMRQVRGDEVMLTPAAMMLRSEAETFPQYHADGGHLLLKRDVLDQQIIDVHGRKVVRVNDVDLDLVGAEPGQRDLRALSVDVGLSGALRRLFQGLMPRRWLHRLSELIGINAIPWNMFHLVETDPARRVRLQISYEAFSRLHPADAAEIIEDLAPAERGAVFEALEDGVAAEILGEVSPKMQREILENLEGEKAADVLEEMDPDEAADVLADLPAATSERLLQDMEAAEREEISDLLEYAEHTAGGRMTTDLIALPEAATVADAVAALKAYEGAVEAINTLFLVDAAERPVGMVPLARIVLAEGPKPLRELALEPVVVKEDEREEEVAELFDKYNLLALPVIGSDRRLLGVITVDDVISLLRGR